MNLTIDRKPLLAALSRVVGATDPRSPHRVLSCVRLSADTEDCRLDLVATDLQLTARTSVEAKIGDPGAAVLPAKDLLERVKAMPDAAIALTVKGNDLSLKASGSTRRHTMRGLPADDYPAIEPVPTGGSATKMLAAKLADTLGRIEYAISRDSSRPFLNSALLRWKGGVFAAVATDSHQLAWLTSPDETSSDQEILLPLRALHEVAKLCTGTDGDV